MDTKLKKSHKLATIIITLCILVPAFLLTALYPKIASAMQVKDKYYDEYYNDDQVFSWELQENFINYAMEASYYVYGGLLMESGVKEVNFAVLDYSGWTNDYYDVEQQVQYMATYQHGNESIGTENSLGDNEQTIVATLALTFDAEGNLGIVNFKGKDFQNVTNQWLRTNAEQSIRQYENNVSAYEIKHETEIDENQLVPKNFKIEFAISDQCDFITGYDDTFYRSSEGLMFDVGAEWIILAAGIFVAMMALVLPFFHGLDTGWEKVFSIPFELVVGFGIAAGFGIAGMFYAMGETCRLTDYPKLEIIGTSIMDNVQFGCLLAANFIGWAICFFLEYVVITSVRQLIAKPIYYLKHRLLIVIILRWLKNQCVKVYVRITQIDMREKRNKSILLLVLLNFAIIAGACSLLFLIASVLFYFGDFIFVMWIFTIITLVIYSILLYVFLFKFIGKLQKQYDSILYETTQKAVIEEAKSQNMKTELITNVSHDLKTPLTAIITYVDLLKKEGITEDERKAYIDTLDKKSQRLKVLIEDLFEVSKAQSGNVQMNFMDVDVVSLMKQVKSEMSDQLEASNLTFRWGLPEEKILLSLDGQRTYRVFENLLNNALKYAMPYSRVYVDVMDLEDRVKVLFRNTSAQELNFDPERLTDRFVRGDVSRQSEGSGLGLAIAKSFVELQNGQFQIEVDGDLFKVTLIWQK